MPARDTYEILLKLRDEMTAQLGQVNRTLEQTRTAGVRTQAGIKSMASSFKQAIVPIKAFNQMFKGVMQLGGAAYAIRMVTREVAEMEKAYAKAHPEVNAMIGSTYQIGKAMDSLKASLGGVASALLMPARAELMAWIQAIVKEIDKIPGKLGEVGKTIATVMTFAIKWIGMAYTIEIGVFKLLWAAIDAFVTLVIGIGKTIWAPLKEGFDWVVFGIKTAFQEAINFLIRGVEGLVRKVGDAVGALSGGLLGKELRGLELRGVDFKAVRPQGAQTGEAWKAMSGEFNKKIAVLTQTFDKLIGNVKAVWAFVPGAATPFKVEESDEQKKAREDAEKELLDRLKALAVLSEAHRQTTIDAAKRAREAEDVANKYRAEQVKLLKDMRKKAYEDVQSFLGDPMAEIQNLLNLSGEAAAGVRGGLGEMIGTFFATFGEGMSDLMAKLAELGPLVLLVMALMEVSKGIQEILGPIIENLLTPIIGFLGLLGNIIGTLLLPIFEAFEPLIMALVAALMFVVPLFQLLEPVFRALGVILKGLFFPVILLMQGVVAVLNAIIDGLNWAFGWLGVHMSRMATPALPTFHEGGTADEDMLAVLKKGEIVTNPYKSKGYVAGGEMGAGIVINAPNARYIDKTLAAELVRMGLAGMRA